MHIYKTFIPKPGLAIAARYTRTSSKIITSKDILFSFPLNPSFKIYLLIYSAFFLLRAKIDINLLLLIIIC